MSERETRKGPEEGKEEAEGVSSVVEASYRWRVLECRPFSTSGWSTNTSSETYRRDYP